ncbi:acetyltransferase [Vibrio cholerae]|nr:acetyltransferase [Vibrio cholerae]
MVTVGVFEFCGMRCQPLRRALCTLSVNLQIGGVFGTIYRE